MSAVLARARAATLAHWRQDALARPLGGLLELGAAQAHSTGIAVPQFAPLAAWQVWRPAG